MHVVDICWRCGFAGANCPNGLVSNNVIFNVWNTGLNLRRHNGFGLPCITLAEPDLAAVMDAVEVDPEQQVLVDVRARSVTCRAGAFEGGIPDGARVQLLEGSWNATAVLLEAGDAIERCAAALPYVGGNAP